MSSLKDSRRWAISQQYPDIEHELAAGLGIAPLVARIMAARGIRTVDEGRIFLTPSLERDWQNPSIVPGLTDVADRVECAIRRGESIAVFGDFDVDGITSTCLLTEALRALGAHVRPFIPHRFDEGYGLTASALDRVISECSPSLIVTVDNGIAARNEVAHLLDRGVDIVVTDHHEPADLVPVGVPVADPKLVGESPSRDLAGAGVALKLVQVLGQRLGKPELWRSYTEVAALGTVSDMMNLSRENRALVADGIACMRTTKRPGYIALAALTRTDLSTITADALSFLLIPRLNAAGRMADPTLALDLLLETDPVEAGRLAARLEQINQERRSIEAELTNEAEALVAATYHGERAIVVGGEGWHEGVKGIVASRLVNRYHVPALMFSIEDGIARGSGRSVGSVNLFDAVEQCADLLIRFGGHAGAVGVTCDASKLDELRDRLNVVLSQLPEEDFEDRGEIAATVSLSELDIDTIEEISKLEPFGQGNKVPLLAVTGVVMEGRAVVGKTGDHMRFTATDGKASIPAIMFRVPDIEETVNCDSTVDLVFEAVAERWQGRVKPKLMVKDILRYTASDSVSPVRSEEPCPLPCASESAASYADAPRAIDTGRRSMLSRLPYDQLTRSLLHTFIGASSPHRAQSEALDALRAGSNVLAIMGTGRGKSLIFHVHAVREAVLNGRASIFVYPLRALVSDQSFHLTEALAELGINVGVLTGESSADDRTRLFAKLASGGLDIVLTTPEFLTLHVDQFAASRRVGFIVIDEAHHMAGAKGGNREAYLDMPEVLRKLGSPRVLAVTATASADITAEIKRLLPIDRTIIDDAVRENLELDDDRDSSSRENRLVSIVATGEKCVVYVNSRDQAVVLCRMLRRRVPQLGASIGFYHAGLTRAQRTQVEAAFRSGELQCIVSTSAFGEGVNLPDIRHVVLYHMPFGNVEFNQMSGRAGRDGEPARIHLLYSARDAHINERLLCCMAPCREELVILYRALQTMWRHQRTVSGASLLSASDVEIAQMCMAVDARTPVDERSVPAALGIFEELGFVHVTERADSRGIELVENPGHVDLNCSTRYLEGIHARLEFSAFRGWALSASARDMLARINRPITPTRL